MNNFNIKTTLGIANKLERKSRVEAGIFLTRGASSYLSFNLLEKGKQFNIDNIKQIMFILQEYESSPKGYCLFNDDGEISDMFAGSTEKVICMTLSPEMTSSLSVTENDEFVSFEVVVTFNNGNTYIEDQPMISVSDSLYAQFI